uniref:TetR/AcrR family transcriptional regulator n=1 Tax=Roseihalotalea indica TaxID=2867963 RepID=A0AA49GL17_9BACT|nr:TetR/AcrR family transcriptional regulator [Tunicatimonas sp. TK19036]
MRKEIVLESARELIQKFGLANLIMDDVARYCGMSKKTIYQLFTGKDELVSDLTISFLEEEKDQLCKLVKQLDSPPDQIEAILRFLFHIIETIPHENLFILKRRHNNSFILFENFFLEIEEIMKKTVQKGVEARLFDARINPDFLVENTFQQLYYFHKNIRRLAGENLYELWKEQLYMSITKTFKPQP